MAITTIDGALAGMKQPNFFSKAVGGAMIAGRAHSFWQIAGYPPAAAIVGTPIAITSNSIANPTVVTTATHNLTSGDTVSITGVATSNPTINGNRVVTVTGGTTFTVPVNVATGGTGGTCAVIADGVAGSKTAGLAGEVLTSRSGQIPFTNPGGVLLSYLARFQASGTIAGTLLLCDRLWQNVGFAITLTGEQLFTGASQIPARDINGNNTGDGVYAAVECVTALGNGTPTLTLKYTNQGGTSGKTSTNLMACANTPTLGDAFIMGLAAGDTGIQKAESLTLSSTYTSGTISVVLFRPIAALELPSAMIPNAIDALTGGFARIYDNSVPYFMFIPSTTTTSNLNGQVIFAQG